MRRGRHTVSNIVAAVYCEQKVIFDRQFGKAEPAHIRQLARDGTFNHARFEAEGYARNPLLLADKLAGKAVGRAMRPGDSRCFVATAVYGGSHPSTGILREWRDRVLMKSRGGRLLVGAYYRVSPALLPVLRRHPALASVIRRALDWVVRRVEAGS